MLHRRESKAICKRRRSSCGPVLMDRLGRLGSFTRAVSLPSVNIEVVSVFQKTGADLFWSSWSSLGGGSVSLLSAVPSLGSSPEIQCHAKCDVLTVDLSVVGCFRRGFLDRFNQHFTLHQKLMRSLGSRYNQKLYCDNTYRTSVVKMAKDVSL